MKIFLTQGKINWKYILIVLILAVIVGGGILWWVEKQEVPFVELPEIKKPEKIIETANWKIYQSSKMGFSIKCPPDLNVFLDISLSEPEHLRGDLLISTFFTKTPEKKYEKEFSVRIESWTPPPEEFLKEISMEKFDFQDWIDMEIAGFKFHGALQLKQEEFLLDNKPATKVSFIEPYRDQTVRIVYTQKENRMYKIDARIDSEKQDIYLSVFNQMLSTFTLH